MQISAGSKNPAKWQAVSEVFKEYEVIAMDTPSLVSGQPFSDAETREGAVNRAFAGMGANRIGIGLEGGVMYSGRQLYLCNWGALVTPDKQIYTASGARIALPKTVTVQLESGAELGLVMEAYTDNRDVRKKEGAIGIFTNGRISRKDMFIHVVQMLRGQWECK
jgi:inosine/xanthosine triphosphatase